MPAAFFGGELWGAFNIASEMFEGTFDNPDEVPSAEEFAEEAARKLEERINLNNAGSDTDSNKDRRGNDSPPEPFPDNGGICNCMIAALPSLSKIGLFNSFSKTVHAQALADNKKDYENPKPKSPASDQAQDDFLAIALRGAMKYYGSVNNIHEAIPGHNLRVYNALAILFEIDSIFAISSNGIETPPELLDKYFEMMLKPDMRLLDLFRTASDDGQEYAAAINDIIWD